MSINDSDCVGPRNGDCSPGNELEVGSAHRVLQHTHSHQLLQKYHSEIDLTMSSQLQIASAVFTRALQISNSNSANFPQVVDAFKLSQALKKMNTAEVACNSFVDFFMGLNPKGSPLASNPKDSPSDNTTDGKGFANSERTSGPSSGPSGGSDTRNILIAIIIWRTFTGCILSHLLQVLLCL